MYIMNNTKNISLNAFKQPRSFYLIFSIELWKRFGFSGLWGILTIYLTQMLGMSETQYFIITSCFYCAGLWFCCNWWMVR